MSADPANAASKGLRNTLLVLSGFLLSLGAVVGAVNTIFTDTKQWACGIGLPFSWCALSAAAETWSAEVGGPGGGPFNKITCRPGQVLVGLSGRADLAPFISSLGPICAVARFDRNQQLVSLSSETLSRGNEVGSNLGDPFELKCPSNMLMIGSELYSDLANIGWGPTSYLVKPLVLKCSTILSSADESSIVRRAGAGERSPSASRRPFYCPDGSAAFGISGRAGAYIDALSIGCREHK